MLSLKEREFCEAARAAGARNVAIIVRHLLPNALTPIIIYRQAEELLQQDIGYVPVVWGVLFGMFKPWVQGIPRNRQEKVMVDGNIYRWAREHMYILEHSWNTRTNRRTSAWCTVRRPPASGAQHWAQAAGDNLLCLRDHALDDLGSRQDRINQTGVLADQNGGIVHIA